MYRGASSPTLAKDVEVNKFSELGRQGCVRTSFTVGRVGQTPGASDDHTLLRAHTRCTAEAGEQKAGQFGNQCSIPNPSALVRPWFPSLARWQNPSASSGNMQILGAPLQSHQVRTTWDGETGVCASNKLSWGSQAVFPSLSLELLDSSRVPCKLMMLLFKATDSPPKTDPVPRTWNG